MCRSRIASWLAALSLAIPASAQSALPEPLAQQLATFPIDRLCSKGGSLGRKFGSTNTGIRPAPHALGMTKEKLDPALTPFVDAEFNVTRRSHRFFFAGAQTIKFDSEEAANQARSQLTARFLAAGWVASIRSPEDDGPLIDSAPMKNEDLLYSAKGVESPGTEPGVRLSLWADSDRLIVECSSMALAREQVDEVFGPVKFTPGTPVNLPPAPPPIAVSDCSDPAQRAAIIDNLTTLPQMEYRKSITEQYSARSEARIDQLGQKAHWSDEEKADYALGLLDDPELKRVTGQLLKPAEIIANYGLAMLGNKGPSDEEFCRSLASSLNEQMAQVPALAERQYNRTVELVDAEAKRLGVSLKD